MKILVVKRDKIGDLLLTTPMLEHLKANAPEAEVHLLANDYNSWVVAGNRNLDRLWTYRRVRHAGRISLAAAWDQARQHFELRRQCYDAAIVANGEESPRAIRRALHAGARRVVAYCGARRYRGLTDPLPAPEGVHECDRLLALLAPLGIAAPVRAPLPEYRLPLEQETFARTWLRERGLQAHARTRHRVHVDAGGKHQRTLSRRRRCGAAGARGGGAAYPSLPGTASARDRPHLECAWLDLSRQRADAFCRSKRGRRAGSLRRDRRLAQPPAVGASRCARRLSRGCKKRGRTA